MQIFLSCQEDKYSRLDTSNTKIVPLVMILSTEVEYFLVAFLATRETVVLLANDLIMSGTSILSFRYLEHQNPSLNG